MQAITVSIPARAAYSYPIRIEPGLLLQHEKWLPQHLTTYHIVIITDEAVKSRYAERLAKALKEEGRQVLLLSIPPGEKSKNYKTKNTLEEQMLSHHCGRDTLILAIGGGVVGDLAGFVAATYMRGIPYIHLPTTLLAMVDSSVGGKTSINHKQGKNLIGAFWQPEVVVADLDCLKTLPKKQVINGLIEALKMFLTHDKAHFFQAQKELKNLLLGDVQRLQTLVQQAVMIKADIVSLDEKENNQRMILNFGHTMGHAIELVSHYKILHGYAVGYGILVEAKIAQLSGLLKPADYHTIQSVWAKLGLLGRHLKKFNVHSLIQATQVDKKSRSGKVYYVLLKQIGEIHSLDQRVAHLVSDEIVERAFLAVTKEVSDGGE